MSASYSRPSFLTYAPFFSGASGRTVTSLKKHTVESHTSLMHTSLMKSCKIIVINCETLLKNKIPLKGIFKICINFEKKTLPERLRVFFVKDNFLEKNTLFSQFLYWYIQSQCCHHAEITTNQLTNRSNHYRCSAKKDVLKNFSEFTGNHLWQSLFF